MSSLDTKADFEILYNKYADVLYRLALVNVNNPSDAEDIVHDVFIKWFEHHPVFNGDAHEEGWLVKVTVNSCRDFNRKKARRSHDSIDEIHHIKSEDKEPSFVIESLAQVPERYRSVLVLHYLEDYSVAQISKAFGLSQSAVKMRLSRGREILKNIIEKEDNRD